MKVKALLFLGLLAAMSFTTNAQTPTRAEDKYVLSEDLVLNAGETKVVQMDFWSKTGYACIQGDLHVNNDALSFPEFEDYDEDLEETTYSQAKVMGRASRMAIGASTPTEYDAYKNPYPCDFRWILSHMQNQQIPARHPDTYTGSAGYGIFTFQIKCAEDAVSGTYDALINRTVYSTGIAEDQTNGVDGYGANTEFQYQVIGSSVTGVNDVNAAKNVSSVKYYNIAGVESNVPFEGVNVVVTTYEDGTKAATKVIK